VLATEPAWSFVILIWIRAKALFLAVSYTTAL
jgi:hypothetical protein